MSTASKVLEFKQDLKENTTTDEAYAQMKSSPFPTFEPPVAGGVVPVVPVVPVVVPVTSENKNAKRCQWWYQCVAK